MRKITAIGAVAVAVVLVALLFGALAPAAPVAAQNTACFRPQGGASFECGDGGSFVAADGAQILVESGGTLEVASGATLVMDGYVTSEVTDLVVAETATFTGDVGMIDDLVIGGNVDVTGNVEVEDHLLTQAELYLIPPATQTVVNGGTITGTGGIVEVTAAGEVTATLVTASDGQILILVNVGSNAINSVDTGTTKLAGNMALGGDDTLMLIGAGVTWYEVSRSAN